EESRRLAFASEAGALREFAQVRPAQYWIGHYLQSGGATFEVPCLTAREIDPGRFVVLRFDQAAAAAVTDDYPEEAFEVYTARDKRYFFTNEVVKMRRDAAATRLAVDRAVERQLISDVPLGVFLSGGIDSSVIALCARRKGPLKTFSISFDDTRYDESE